MADTPYATGDDNDLPRTVRAQKEARIRDQMAREILNAPPRHGHSREAAARDAKAAAQRAEQTHAAGQSQAMHLQSDGGRAQSYAQNAHAEPLPPGYAAPAVVTRFKLPFFHLMLFFLKCVLAAIPALLLAGAIIFAIGQAAQTYFPWLIKMKVLITFP